jgi:hypothetical protein
VANPEPLLEAIRQLDEKNKDWAHLPNSHPDIQKLQALNPYVIKSNTLWTKENEAYVRANYKSKTDKEIAYHLGMTEQQVVNFRGRLKLKRSKSYSTAVIQMDLDGNEIARFESLNKAAKAVGMARRSISLAISADRPSKGYRWKCE